jgi:DNA polymerase-4
MAPSRAILHVDMDAFYASVEQRDRPELAGRPVLVAHDGARGVVSAASYESRVFGCRSAQPTAVARRLCPHAVIVPPRHGHYSAVSAQVFAILESVTPLVEPLSIDEAFLDVTGSTRLFGEPRAIAASIKGRIRTELSLTASVGLAPNKFLAKLASEWHKPDGLTVVEASELPGRLAELPIRRMWGVGPKYEAELLRRGIATFGDLQRLSLEQVASKLGPHGADLWRLARGEDDRPVVPDRESKSVGAEETFGEDLREPEALRAVLLEHVDRVAARLRRHQLVGRTVTVKIRFGDFQTITRSATLPATTDRSDRLGRAAGELLARWVAESFQPVRLIGVSVSQLQREGAGQGGLFLDPEDERGRRVDRATDAIRERFGAESVRRGFPPQR